MGFFQERPDGIVVDKCYADNLKPISTYIGIIKDYFRRTNHVQGNIWLPHDARAKSLQTGKSIVEQFKFHSLRPKIVPELSLLDGIAATRQTFPILYYNKAETKDLVLAMKSYYRKYDEDRKVFTDEPVHDWSSHYADMQRYMALIANKKTYSSAQGGIVQPGIGGVHYNFALNDIWDLTPRRSARL